MRLTTTEPGQSISYKIACATSEDSDQLTLWYVFYRVAEDPTRLFADSEDWSACADVQTNQSFCLMHMQSYKKLVVQVMPGLHLPRTAHDLLVYDFLCGFSGIVGGYGQRRMSSRDHAYIILTPLNPTFIQKNWGWQGYTLFFLFLLKT